MLDQLTNLVRQHAGDLNIPGFPPDKQAQLPEAAGSSIMEAIQQQGGSSGGGLSALGGLLGGGGNMAQSLAGPVAEKLSARLGIPATMASAVISAILPKIMGSLGQDSPAGGNTSMGDPGGLGNLAGGLFGK